MATSQTFVFFRHGGDTERTAFIGRGTFVDAFFVARDQDASGDKRVRVLFGVGHVTQFVFGDGGGLLISKMCFEEEGGGSEAMLMGCTGGRLLVLVVRQTGMGVKATAHGRAEDGVGGRQGQGHPNKTVRCRHYGHS
tara:strand:- start:46 stop:456 length:411 start_codon:yes stop_codon:yes gene_type:complete